MTSLGTNSSDGTVINVDRAVCSCRNSQESLQEGQLQQPVWKSVVVLSEEEALKGKQKAYVNVRRVIVTLGCFKLYLNYIMRYENFTLCKNGKSFSKFMSTPPQWNQANLD